MLNRSKSHRLVPTVQDTQGRRALTVADGRPSAWCVSALKAKIASGEYTVVDSTSSKAKSDVWVKFGVVTVRAPLSAALLLVNSAKKC